MTEQTQNKTDLLYKNVVATQNEKLKIFKKTCSENDNLAIIEHKVEIVWGELVDLTKLPLVFEKNAEDEKHNKQVMQDAATDYDEEILTFVKQLGEHPKFCLEQLTLATRPVFNDNNDCKSIDVKAMNLSEGKPMDLKDVPPAVLKQLKSALDSAFSNIELEGEGEEEGTAEEASV